MSTRLQRLNPLIHREVSSLLLSRYRAEAAGVTILAVDTSPDLRQARITYSVLGGPEDARRAEIFFAAHRRDIRRELAARITLKYLPELRFVRTDAMAEGERILRLLDQVGPLPPTPEDGAPPPEEDER